MSSTTPRGYRYPEPGDIFAPRQWIENLANDVDDDANSFVSVVGTPVTGNSLTYNGTAWVPGAAAGVIFGTTAGTATEGNDTRVVNAVQRTIVDAKGDLLVGTADNTVARLAVGTDGQVLTADSGETGGVKWAAPAGTRWALRQVAVGGNNVTTPNPLTYSGMTELDVRAHVLIRAYPNAVSVLQHQNVSGQFAWMLSLSSTTLTFDVSSDGVFANRKAVTWTHSGTNLPLDTWVWLRGVWRADNGSSVPDIRVLTSSDGVAWTTQATNATAIPATVWASTEPNVLSASIAMDVQELSLRRDGTVVGVYDARDGIVQRYTDANNNVWTLNGSAWSGRKGI